MNKAPIVFTLEEAATCWQIRPSATVQRQSRFLAARPDFAVRMVKLWSGAGARRVAPIHLEQLLYTGFPDREDEQIASEFHNLSWQGRVTLSRNLGDERLRRWAQRLIYADAPDFVSLADRERLDKAIASRLLNDNRDPLLWRGIPSAQRELATMEPNDPFVAEMKNYLATLRSKWAASLCVDEISACFER